MLGPDKFEQLKSCSGPDFEQFYRVYAESISQREQKSRDWICAMAGRADYKVLLLKQNEQVSGFSILFLPAAGGFGLLEYMAVSGEQRNHGLGGQIFRRTMESLQPQSVPVLLEVDSDREECADRALRARRQGFYRRLGCLRLAQLRYILPLPGSAPPPEMDLMIYPAGGHKQIAKAQLERWLNLIYQHVYHCPSEDPRIRQMLIGVSDPVRFE